jgi:hypothetical protein
MMARSTYIYVVLHPAPANMGDHLVKAFTVKHELRAWWNHCDHPYKFEYEIWRIRDGGSDLDAKTRIHVSEL